MGLGVRGALVFPPERWGRRVSSRDRTVLLELEGGLGLGLGLGEGPRGAAGTQVSLAGPEMAAGPGQEGAIIEKGDREGCTGKDSVIRGRAKPRTATEVPPWVMFRASEQPRGKGSRG